MYNLPLVHNFINPETGKTYKQENLGKKHQIPIGSLVEVKYDAWYGAACEKVHARLWVVAHTRDCDGTPLYTLSRWRHPELALRVDPRTGFGEESLTPIDVTPEVERGQGALEWPEGEV